MNDSKRTAVASVVVNSVLRKQEITIYDAIYGVMGQYAVISDVVLFRKNPIACVHTHTHTHTIIHACKYDNS